MIVSGLTPKNVFSKLRFQGEDMEVSLTLDWYRENINDIFEPDMFKNLFGQEVDLTKENLLKMSIARHRVCMACFDLELLAYVILNDTGYIIWRQFAEIAKAHQLERLKDDYDDMMEKLAGPFAKMNADLKNATTDAQKKAIQKIYYDFRQNYHNRHNFVIKREWESYRMQIAVMLYNCLSMLNEDLLVHL